jgi:hypothetical protein
MTSPNERPCDRCGLPITVTSRNPNRRFCSQTCRAAAHRAYQRATARPTNGVTNDVPAPDAVRDVVASANAVPAANGVQHCPHCRHPLAVISVLVPAAAAHIPTPELHHA